MAKRKILLLAILVGLISVLPFLRSLNDGVVAIDDYTYVVEHSQINGGFPDADFRWMFVNTDHGIFMPLTWFSYLTDCEIARRLTPDVASLDEREAVRFRIMHLHCALLHGVNAALVFVFLLYLSSALPKGGVLAALAAALFWGLHPLRTESVAWIASRKDLVSFFWLLLGLISWIRWRLQPGDRCERPTFRYWLSLAFVIIGALGKPSVMVFPGLVFLIDLLVLRQLELRKAGNWNVQGLLAYVLPLLIGICVSIEATAFQNAGGAMEYPMPLWYRILNAPVSYGVYLKNEFWPQNLALQCVLRYPHPPHFLLPGLAIFGACMLYFVRAFRKITASGFEIREANFTLMGSLWFFGSLIPFIGVVGFGYHSYADRFTYIPSIGISIALLGVILRARYKKLYLVSALAVVLALIPITVRQVAFWETEESIWKHTLDVDGDLNIVANVCLGQYAYDVHHDVATALKYFDAAYRIDPSFTTRFGTTYMNVISEAGDREKAYDYFKYYREWNAARMAVEEPNAPHGAIVWGADFAAARIAMLLTETNFLASVEQDLNELLQTHPKNQNALYLKGRLAELKGDRAAAKRAWREVVDAVKPEDCFVRYRFLKTIAR